MRTLIILGLIAIAFARVELDNTTFAKFMKFTNEHQKVYKDQAEFYSRFEVFKQNLQKVSGLHSAYLLAKESPTFQFGVTPFMDLTTEEFQQKYLNLKIDYTIRENALNSQNTFKASKLNDTPASYDWREHGAVTKVKNQGMCGSCWAFSAVGNLEGQHQIKTGGSAIDLSPQQLVDCDKVDQGCNGGLMEDAFNYVKSAGGIESESDYSYKGYDASCSFDSSKVVAKVNGFKFAGTEDEEQIKTFLYQTGPLAVALNATPLQFYFWGIFNPWFTWICDPQALNHGVLMVGYGVEGSTKYWIVKNSWGSSWGESGYFRIIAGKGACGINTYVITANLQ